MRSTPLLAMLLLAASLLLALLPGSTDAHGFLLAPMSRAKALGLDDWVAAEGNGFKNNGNPDVCGDPHQDSGDLNLKNRQTAIQATYAPGSVITVTHRLTTNHGGWIGLKICPSTRVGPTQGCFDQYPLTNADTGFTRWWLQTKSQTDFTTRWRLPSGVSCSGGCVMQWTYKTANSCVDACSSNECSSVYTARGNPVTGQRSLDACSASSPRPTSGWGEVFRDCADIAITGSSGPTPAPTPKPTAKPTPTPTRAPTPAPAASCSWPGHCRGATCTTYDDCSDVLTCVAGKCA